MYFVEGFTKYNEGFLGMGETPELAFRNLRNNATMDIDMENSLTWFFANETKINVEVTYTFIEE